MGRAHMESFSISLVLVWKKPGHLSASKVLLEQREAAGQLTSEVLVEREDEWGQWYHLVLLHVASEKRNKTFLNSEVHIRPI